MKNIRYWIVVITLLCATGSEIRAQEFNWVRMAQEGFTFSEIWDASMENFSANGKGRGTGYKQFRRWAIEAGYSIDSQGNVMNTQQYNVMAYKSLSKQVKQSHQRLFAGEWEAIGPYDYTDPYFNSGAMGRTSRIAFHPTNASQFYVGTAAGGIWKTTDAGVNWTPITDAMTNLGVSGILVDQSNPNIMYLLTGDGDAVHTFSIGLLKSSNAGASWQTTGLTWNENSLVRTYALVMDYSDHEVLLVGTNEGVFRSDDGGGTWSQTWSGLVWDIEQDIDDPDIFYAASDTTLLKSIDEGVTWEVKYDINFPSDTLFQRMAIAVSPSAPSTVYALFGGDTGVSGTFYGMYKSTDNGENFTQQSTTPNILGWETDGSDDEDQAGRNLTIVVHPTNDAIVFTGGINVWKSTNNGINWEAQTDWQRANPDLPWIHADQLDMKYNNGSLYVCADGGVYRTDNSGSDWTELSSGLAITQYYYIDILNNNYTGGSQDNGTTSTDVSNPQATVIYHGDGFGCVYHYGNPSITYLSNQNKKIRRQFGVETDISPFGLDDFWNSDLDMHTSDPDYLFVAHKTDIFRGNGGIAAGSWTWDSLQTTFTSSTRDISTITQGVDNPEVMYASNDVELLKTSNLSSPSISWTLLTEPTGAPDALTDVLVDPDDAERIWACYGGYINGEKVYYSDDGGGTWVNISGSLPNTRTHCLLYWPGSNDGIYLGTDLGIFYREATMTDWIYFSNGLPAVIVKDLDDDNGYLYAGTFGRGIWRTEPYTGCPNSLVLTQANDPSPPGSTGQQTYYTITSLTSSREIKGGSGTEVKYYSENYIDLIDGFRAFPGNLLTVRIENCPE